MKNMKMKNIKRLMLTLCLQWSATGFAVSSLDLSGEWRFQIDPSDAGEEEQWFSQELSETIKLPGSLQEQGFGESPSIRTKWMAKTGVRRTDYPDYFTSPIYKKYREDETFRFPYWLQPKKHYIGSAWYQRSFDIPASWKGQRIELNLERCHWGSTVWLNGQIIGSCDAMGMPHVYDLSQWANPGEANELTLRIDNRMIVNVGKNAHSIGDQTQSAWNGVIGKIKLESRPAVWIKSIQILPDIKTQKATMVIKIGNLLGNKKKVQVKVQVSGAGKQFPIQKADVTVNGEELLYRMEYPMGEDVELWDEFNPVVYNASVELCAGASEEVMNDSQEMPFGMREVGVKGTQIVVNGKPVFMRGTLECCIFPLTGYPPTDIGSWRRIMKRVKEYGLNHIRFHSWCPPEAAFDAADEEGVYLQPEVSMWAGISSQEQFDWAAREARRMLETYGNHPSFLMMSIGNEMAVSAERMTTLLKEWKQDARHIYAVPCNSNGTAKHVQGFDDFYVGRYWGKEKLRYQQGWPPLPRNSLFTALPPQTSIDWREGISQKKGPFIAHETVQRCSYPNPAWQSKYTGSFRAAYLDIARDQLAERGMTDLVDQMVENSGVWQVQQFKEEIEAALRTPGMAGFQLLDLHDFPGQGAALVGVLDAFWDDKGYVTGNEFRRFCSPTVPLARMEKRTWTSDETFFAQVDVAHFGTAPLKGCAPEVVIKGAAGNVHYRTTLPQTDIAIGSGIKLGSVSVDLSNIPAPAKLTLEVKIGGAENDWNFWVYPGQLPISGAGEVVVTKMLDETREALKAGSKVLWLPDHKKIRGGIPQCFSSIYWNAPYTNGGESQTMGMICEPKHKLFSLFPTDKTVNWQWWELLTKAKPMILDEWQARSPWPTNHHPLIQPIDDWNLNRKLALVAEAKVGAGTLVICSMDIETNLDQRIVARQFRTSLLAYMNGDDFAPNNVIGFEQLAGIIEPLEKNAGVALESVFADGVLRVSSAAMGYGAQNLMDGNPKSLWHTPWKDQPIPDYPHEITMVLKEPRQIQGIRLLPRQKQTAGRVKQIEVYLSRDGVAWGDPVVASTLSSDGEWKTIDFQKSTMTKAVKVKCLCPQNAAHHFASFAEMELVHGEGQ
jgi:hypothetical protein